MKPASVQVSEQIEQNNFTVCKVCGLQVKRLTNSHLARHGLTTSEYISQHEPEKTMQRRVLAFINEFYITLRYRWIEAAPGKDGGFFTVKRPWKLNDSDIIDHLNGKRTIGLYFPQKVSKFIGFDVDTLDREVLNNVYQAVIRLGVAEESILMSYSGNKGYHLDIFLSEPLDKASIKQFYETVLNETGATKKQLELRGGGGQAYKLPFGYHAKTGRYCFICNEYGDQIPLEHLANIKAMDPRGICDAVDINYIGRDNDLLIQAEELDGQITPLESYSRTNENSIRQVEKLIAEGLHEKGRRHVAVRTVSAYLKDIKGLCLADAAAFIQNWIGQTWSPGIVEKTTRRDATDTVKSVYSTGFKFKVHANSVKVSLPEIREIFSINTGNKLQTEALRRLYYCLLLHSKAYSGDDGVFYMSYNQLSAMGACQNEAYVFKQIRQLEQLGKLQVIQRNRNAGKGSGSKAFKQPNKYLLPALMEYEAQGASFHVCGQGKRCANCMYSALCHLAADGERKQLSNKRFRTLPRCPFNSKL